MGAGTLFTSSGSSSSARADAAGAAHGLPIVVITVLETGPPVSQIIELFPSLLSQQQEIIGSPKTFVVHQTIRALPFTLGIVVDIIWHLQIQVLNLLK